MTDRGYRGYRFDEFKCTPEDAANVMLTLARLSFICDVEYRIANGKVTYSIDLASPLLAGGDGPAASAMVHRFLDKVPALHAVNESARDPERGPEAA